MFQGFSDGILRGLRNISPRKYPRTRCCGAKRKVYTRREKKRVTPVIQGPKALKTRKRQRRKNQATPQSIPVHRPKILGTKVKEQDGPKDPYTNSGIIRPFGVGSRWHRQYPDDPANSKPWNPVLLPRFRKRSMGNLGARDWDDLEKRYWDDLELGARSYNDLDGLQ